MIFHPDVLAAHAQFGGDLESMQKLYEYPELKAEVERLRAAKDPAPAEKAEPVAWLRHGEKVPVRGCPFGAMWISDKNDPRAFPVYAEQPLPASQLVTGTVPVGYATKNELTKLRLGASCIDLFGEVVPKGFEMVPLYSHPPAERKAP